MTNKEKAEMTRLWWKLVQGKATSVDIKRYRGLRVQMIKEKGKDLARSKNLRLGNLI